MANADPSMDEVLRVADEVVRDIEPSLAVAGGVRPGGEHTLELVITDQSGRHDACQVVISLEHRLTLDAVRCYVDEVVRMHVAPQS